MGRRKKKENKKKKGRITCVSAKKLHKMSMQRSNCQNWDGKKENEILKQILYASYLQRCPSRIRHLGRIVSPCDKWRAAMVAYKGTAQRFKFCT